MVVDAKVWEVGTSAALNWRRAPAEESPLGLPGPRSLAEGLWVAPKPPEPCAKLCLHVLSWEPVTASVRFPHLSLALKSVRDVFWGAA